MAATPESKVKKRIKELLDANGAYYHMPVLSRWGQKSIDFFVCYRGHFIAIEAKAPKEKPSKLQELTLKNIISAGGTAVVEDSEGCETLKIVLRGIDMKRGRTIMTSPVEV